MTDLLAQVNTVPDAMKAYKQFVLWRMNGTDKVPINANGQLISAQDATQWLTYDEAVATHMPIGFVFTANDPFVFIDLDKCIRPDGPTKFAKTVLEWFPNAAYETSQSGTGVHLFLSGAETILGQHKTRSKQWPGLEVYSQGRFVALTGLDMRGDANADYRHLLHKFIRDFGMYTNPAETANVTNTTVRPEYTGPVDDQKLIGIMLSSVGSANQLFSGAAHIRDLWSCNDAQLAIYYPDGARSFDRSAADMALFNHLAFWTGCDARRMARMFTTSALYRPDRYEGKGAYRIELLIKKAIGSCKSVYSVAGATGTNAWEYKIPEQQKTRVHELNKVDLSWSNLKSIDFAPTEYLVPGLISEGVTLFAAKPKVGKSMFAIGLACAVLTGGSFMGRAVSKGSVFHLGLEDSPARLQKRYRHVMKACAMDANADWPVHFKTAGQLEDPRELLPMLQTRMDLFPDTKLIIIDTLKQMRLLEAPKGENAYDADRAALDPVTNWRHGFPGLAVVVIHHNRKDAQSDDPYDDISGSTGLTGAVDNVMVAREDRSSDEMEVTLSGRGREIEEFQITTRMIDGIWHNLGDVDEVLSDRSEAKIMDELKRSPQSLSWRDISDPAELTKSVFFRAIKKLVARGLVDKDGTKYRISPFSDISRPKS